MLTASVRVVTQQLQGRTLPKLIISIFKRTTPPWMNLASFYVLISRCRTSSSLRLLQYDLEGLNAVCALKHDCIPNDIGAMPTTGATRVILGNKQKEGELGMQTCWNWFDCCRSHGMRA